MAQLARKHGLQLHFARVQCSESLGIRLGWAEARHMLFTPCPVIGKVLRAEKLLMRNRLLDVAHPIDMGNPCGSIITRLTITE